MEIWGGNRATDKQLEMPGLRAWVYSRPHGSSLGGGDVYYLSSCASGRISRVLLADVSGHGELVSVLGVGLRDLMRKNVNWVKQTRLVRAMNRQFSALAEQGGFATAVATTFFSPTRSLSVCNAGHPTPLLYRIDRRQWAGIAQQPSRPGKFTNTPLGIVDQAEYVQVEMAFQPGDLALLVSDALTEARDSEGRMLGMQGLLEIVSDLNANEPDALIPRLLRSIESRSSGSLSEDDTTLVLLQATGTRSRFVDNLCAPLRLLRGVTDATAIAQP
jgi:serine phosphatase RsbU (regulator of sigma subunit)